MKELIPSKLTPGDHVRVIAPACSLAGIDSDIRKLAISRLQELQLTVSFGQNVAEQDIFNSSSVESRINDIHDAFKDPSVKGILAAIGGYNTNQLLTRLDYQLIAENPKILCGYSDITALSNAMYARTGLVTYSGPHFSSFGMEKGFDYSLEYFKKCLFENHSFEIKPSSNWSDDAWYKDQDNRTFIHNSGFDILNIGHAEGKIIGGNLCTLNLLQGTDFMPSLKDAILFLEDDYEVHPATFDRDLQSLIHQKDFNQVKGIVIGRFQKASRISLEHLRQIINTKVELSTLPVVSNIDFGHTYPQITFPIGGTVRLSATEQGTSIVIVKH